MLGAKRTSTTASRAYPGSSAPRPSHLSAIGASKGSFVGTLLEKIGIQKGKVVDFTTEQQQAIEETAKECQGLEEETQRIKQSIVAEMRKNPKRTSFPQEKARLEQIALEKGSLEGFIRTLVVQQSQIKQTRKKTSVLGVVSRGNQELKAETARAKDMADASSILDDTDELLNEAIEDQIEIYQSLNTMGTIGESIGSVSVGDGEATIGDAVTDVIASLRLEVQAEQEASALEARETFPSMKSLPTLSGRAASPSPQPRQPVSSQPLSSSSSITQSPFVKANRPSINFSEELDWLQ